MPIPSKQCIANALVHMKAKRKWKPLNDAIGGAYEGRDYFQPIYHNALKSNGQMLWTPRELYVLRSAKITPHKLQDLLFQP